MANYVENIRIGSGESWPVRDAEAQQSIEALLGTIKELTTQLTTATEELETLKTTVPTHEHAYLPLAGGTLTGPLTLTLDVHYGDTLPDPGTAGRIFLKKVSS